MHRFLVLIISLFALALTACPPAPPALPAEATASSTAATTSGAGGDAGRADPADAAATSAEASTSTATGDPFVGCIVPAPKHKVCDTPNDCYDGSACSEDLCDLGTPPDPPDPFGRKGTCIWRLLPDGAPCDVSDSNQDVCRAGACCPGAAEPAPDAGAVTNVLPEAR